jgi:tRNA-splicing ligase RtcB
MQGGNATKVSARAKARGRKQLGTLGAGNHFLEIQYVEEVYDEEIARVFDADVNQVMIMIHCGSRGLGHQVCSDYLRKMEDAFPDIMQKLPEKDLIYAPLSTALAQDYFQAMVCAANFAWANRHIIAHFVRNGFRKVLPDSELSLVYDVAHNIAKKEEHVVDGTKRELLVHRKGATRAFPPGHFQIPSKYRKIGQPVLIPGSMGTSSYVLVGTSEGMSISMGSAPHGAGRLMSRKAALKKFRGSDVKQQLASQKILVKAASMRGISEEAPQCYKEIDEVIKVAMKTGIAKPVLKLRPLGVIKG